MKQHAFKNNHLFVNGVELTHLADGDDAITIKRRTPIASSKVGVQGNMVVSVSSDRSGEITVKLQQTSPSNKYLAGLAALEQAGAETFVPVALLWQDGFRQDRGVGAMGYIEEWPEIGRGAEAKEQVWKFVVERLDLLLGDPAFVGLATAAAEAA